MKQKFIFILPLIALLYCIEAFIVNISFEYEIPIISEFEEQLEEIVVSDEPKEIVPEIKFSKGVFFRIAEISSLLDYLKDDQIPIDGSLEKSIDKLERVLLSNKISIAIWCFLGLLSISSFVSLYQNAWFAPFTARFLFLVTAIIAFQNLSLSTNHMIRIPFYGFVAFLTHLVSLVLMIWGFRKLGKKDQIENMSFYNLFIASQNDEESNTGKIIISTKKSESAFKNSFVNWIMTSIPIKMFLFFFTNHIVRHFILIIASGILIGNIIYIPLFSLQKNYSSQFGFLLLISIILLSLFYIRNYYSFIKEESEIKTFWGILISTAFLQFRFLRNTFYFVITTAGVIFFIVAIFLLLTVNTVILKNYQIIDRTINL